MVSPKKMQIKARKVVCALDTPDIQFAIDMVRKLEPYVGAFKVGHALTLNHGLDVVCRLQDVGAERIFLDLKFHDIPNAVALAVAEASKRGVWMMTVHIAGGPAMLAAARVEASPIALEERSLLIGCSVLTSLDEKFLREDMSVSRSLEDQVVYLSKLGVDYGLDGVVCSPHEIRAIRERIGHQPIIVTPGIRLPNADVQDQQRVGEPLRAIEDGANYIVIGRALTSVDDPRGSLEKMGLLDPAFV